MAEYVSTEQRGWATHVSPSLQQRPRAAVCKNLAKLQSGTHHDGLGEKMAI